MKEFLHARMLANRRQKLNLELRETHLCVSNLDGNVFGEMSTCGQENGRTRSCNLPSLTASSATSESVGEIISIKDKHTAPAPRRFLSPAVNSSNGRCQRMSLLPWANTTKRMFGKLFLHSKNVTAGMRNLLLHSRQDLIELFYERRLFAEDTPQGDGSHLRFMAFHSADGNTVVTASGPGHTT